MSTSFLYQNAKDVLRWNNLSVKKHIGDIMRIGTFLFLSDEDFEEIKNKSKYTEIDIDQLKDIYNS